MHGQLFDQQEFKLAELDRHLDQFGLAGVPADESSDVSPIQRFSHRMAETARNAGKSRWCLKDPEVSEYLDQYADAFPAAQFVIIVRDPRAVARSFLERGTSCNWFAAGERWSEEVARQLEFHRRHQERSLLVKYEDLVENLSKELCRVCEFLQISFDEDLVRYHERDSGIVIHEGNKNVQRPPDKTINEKWRTSLNPRQLACVEASAARIMQEMGYQQESQIAAPSHLSQAFYRWHNRVVWEYRWQRASRWFGIRKRFARLAGRTATWDLSKSHGKFR